MDYWDVTKLLARRWYIAAPLLLLTVLLTGFMATAIEPDYQLTSYVQLIPPVSSPDKNPNAPQNPWNQLGLDALAEAGDYATLDQTYLDTLKKGGYSTNISIIPSEPPAGATIQVVAPTREQAVRTTALTVQRFTDNIRDLQVSYGIRAQDLITTTQLDAGENLKRPSGKVKRAILAVAGAGLLVTGASTIAVDAIMRRRRRRAAGEGAGSGAPDAGQPTAVVAVEPTGSRRRDLVTAVGMRSVRRFPGSAPAPGDVALAPGRTTDATVILPRSTEQWVHGENGGQKR